LLESLGRGNVPGITYNVDDPRIPVVEVLVALDETWPTSTLEMPVGLGLGVGDQMLDVGKSSWIVRVEYGLMFISVRRKKEAARALER
jgi:hypothetical protein